MVEGEIDNDDNDEYVYYFIMERAPARSQRWNEGWGYVVGRLMGCNSLFSLHFLIFLCSLHQEARELPGYFNRDRKSRISRIDC